MDNDFFMNEQKEKLDKLKRMRIIATGLLILMTVCYFILKKFETQNLFLSSAAAFTEAAMIGALADWFAVVALFRHPLGMSWIPHTAIIQKNQEKIGESLSSFVVSNFFTPEVIRNKLQNVNFAESIAKYFKENRGEISVIITAQIPKTAELFFESNYFQGLIQHDLKNKLKGVNLHPMLEKIMKASVNAELHVPIAKQLLTVINKWVNENKEKTLKMIEGMNKGFALPFVGDIVYNSIIKTLAKLLEDIESGVPSDFNKELLHKLPQKAVRDFERSKEWELKVEGFKNDLLDSEAYQQFMEEKLSYIEERFINNIRNSPEVMHARVSDLIVYLADECLMNDSIQSSLDSWIKEGIISVIGKYKQDIGKLISETVKEWPMEDMVQKLETQVGGDLQYIRINGTIIGGLAGVAIHLVSRWI
ncbi:MAG: hypothetical protein K0R31_162 [Clostridiales bacterium]|jgi:uncharacterized membrane-anchored protein YjiN (DUF445 family)|nr:hypothetical protein [Clostridiales bacterium]